MAHKYEESNEGLNPEQYVDERTKLGAAIQLRLAGFEAVNSSLTHGLLEELKEIFSRLNARMSADEYRKAEARANEIFDQLGEPQV